MRSRPSPFFWLLLGGTLWAAWTHVHQIVTLPPQAWADEIWFALRARELAQTGHFEIYYRTFWGGVHPALVWLVTAAWAAGFHRLIVSRMVTAVCATLSVPLTYVCLNEMWRSVWPAPRRRLTAALAALILSNLLYLVIVTRIGTEPALALTAMLGCVWLMRRARRTGRWGLWLLAGAALGGAQYISPHARFFLPLLGLWALGDLFTSPPEQRAALFGRLSAFGGAAVICALPLIIFFVREPEWFFGRLQATTHLSRSAGAFYWLDNARLIGLGFNVSGDLNARHNLPGRPMFDGLQGVGWWLGIAWALGHLRRTSAAPALLAWTGLMMTPSLLTDNAPHFERMTCLAPPAAALIAIGWVSAEQWLARRFDLPRAVRLAVGASGVALSLGLNAYLYFGPYAAWPELAEAFTTTPVQEARALVKRSQTETVVVEHIPAPLDVLPFDFFFPGTPVRRADLRGCTLLAANQGQPRVYLVLANSDTVTVPSLQTFFPAAQVTYLPVEIEALSGDLLRVEIPANAQLPFDLDHQAHFAPSGIILNAYALERSGERLTATLKDGDPHYTVPAGETLTLTQVWQATQAVDTDLTIFTHVGSGEPVAQGDGPPCAWFMPTSSWQAGDWIISRLPLAIPAQTPAGTYPLFTGLYAYASMDRQTLVSADFVSPAWGQSDNRAGLGWLTVTPP